MKWFLLGLLAGFVLNSGLRSYYTYLWWTAEKTVSNSEYNRSVEKYGYPQIIFDRIGVQDNIKYTLIYPCRVLTTWVYCSP